MGHRLCKKKKTRLHGSCASFSHTVVETQVSSKKGLCVQQREIKAVVKYVGGFWPIGVFLLVIVRFFLFLVDKLRRKHAFKHANKKKTREDCCIVQVTCVQIFPNTS